MWGSASSLFSSANAVAPASLHAASVPAADRHTASNPGNPTDVPEISPMNGGASSSAGSPAAAQAAGSSGAPTLESAVLKELRAQLLAAHHERDDLLKDVEALCMQGDVGTIFDKSSLLSERIMATNRELSVCRTQLAAVAAERDGLREDLRGVRESKLVADRSWRSEREACAQLERELAFYQAQSASAMSDRDTAAWEAEELRGAAMLLEQSRDAAAAAAESEATAKGDALAALSEARLRVTDLQLQVKGLDVIPGLRKDLESFRAQNAALQASSAKLQVDLSGTRADLAAEKESLSAAAGQCQSLTEQLDRAHTAAAEEAAVIAALSSELAAAAQRADVAEAAAEEAHLSIAELERQSDVQAAALKGARSELEQATQQKVGALMKLSVAQMSAGRAEDRADRSQQQADALKAQLEQAREELAKLGVPLDLAGSEGSPSKGGVPLPQRPATSSRAPYWKMWLGQPQGFSGEAPNPGSIDGEGSHNSTEGPDVHSLRREVGILQERLRHVESTAQQAHRLHAALQEAAVLLKTPDAGVEGLSALDRLKEEARTLRVGVVLGLSPSKKLPSEDEDDTASGTAENGDGGKPSVAAKRKDAGAAQKPAREDDDELDFFSMLRVPSRSAGTGGGGTGGTADGAVAREMLDLVEFSISALRQQAAARPGAALERSISGAIGRSNSGVARSGSSPLSPQNTGTSPASGSYNSSLGRGMG